MDRWVWYAIGAMVMSVVSVLSSKALSISSKASEINLMYSIMFAGLCAAIYLTVRRAEIERVSKRTAGVILVKGLAFFVYLILALKAFEYAPNVGYAHGLINFNVVLTTLIGMVLFQSPISALGAVGIVLSVLGLGTLLGSE